MNSSPTSPPPIRAVRHDTNWKINKPHPMSSHPSTKLKVAVVTGGHPFDLPALQAIFGAAPDLEVYPQHLEDWSTAGERRRWYDVVVFYQMFMEGPLEKGAWYQGDFKQALSELGTTDQGIVVWHHSLLAWPKWDFWTKLVGIEDRSFGYHIGMDLRVSIADPSHPITRGLEGWEMMDETYTMREPSSEGNRILLTVDHPKSMKAIGWVREFGQARVFCFQSGHDDKTFGNPHFREVLLRGIRWTAARPEVEMPPTMPAIWFTDKGQSTIREEATPVCEPGHILCRTLYTGVTNGTERNVMMGGNYGGSWPARCGYQNVGAVVEVASGAKGYEVGDLVFSGNFSQHQSYFAVNASQPESPGHLVIKIPGGIDPRHAALFGMGSVAMNDVREAEIKLGQRILVVGAGPIGQFTAQAARASGAVVAVADLDEHRLEIARDCGAHMTFRVEANQPWDEVRKAGPFDVVFEDSGAPILDRIIGGKEGPGVIKHRGKVIVIAGRDRVDYNFNAGQGSGLRIVQVSHFEQADLKQLCRLVAEGVIKVGPILRDVLPYREAVAFYEKLRDNPASTFGTVFDWAGDGAGNQV